MNELIVLLGSTRLVELAQKESLISVNLLLSHYQLLFYSLVTLSCLADWGRFPFFKCASSFKKVNHGWVMSYEIWGYFPRHCITNGLGWNDLTVLDFIIMIFLVCYSNISIMFKVSTNFYGCIWLMRVCQEHQERWGLRGKGIFIIQDIFTVSTY